MEKIADIKFENGEESFGIAGPWLADCYLNSKKLKYKFVDQNAVFSKDNKYVSLSRFTQPKTVKLFGLFSITPKIRDFKVIVYDIHENVFYVCKKSFNALFIESFIDREIVLFEAFHNELIEYKKNLVFTEQNFIKLDLADIYEN